MSNYLVKGHHAIQKQTAIFDWNNVVSNLSSQNLSSLIVYPKGKHWHKIEDATAAMIEKMEDTSMLVLNRGINYYK